MKASRASHLRRVTGWPTGAVAVGDTVYVNAAWLVALAPGGGRPDAGAGAVPVASGSVALAPSGVTTPSPATLAASTEQQSALASAAAAYGDPDGGISSYYPPTPPPPPPPPPPPEDGTTCWEACAAFSDACANTDSSGCDDGSNDSCDTTDDGSADSCESTSDDGSTESCNSTTDDGSTESCDSTTDDGSASSCQVARSRPAGRGRPTGREGREAWLFMPLGFLMVTGRQRRT